MQGSGTKAADRVVRESLAYADALYNFARYLVRNEAEAEDLVQETYARALGAARRFEPGTDLKAWLFRILRNVHLDRLRRRRHEGGEVRQSNEESTSPPEPEPETDPGQLQALVAQDVARAVDQLPSPYREVILLDLEGFAEKEVAEVLECAPGTVKSRLWRARAELRKLLRAYAP